MEIPLKDGSTAFFLKESGVVAILPRDLNSGPGSVAEVAGFSKPPDPSEKIVQRFRDEGFFDKEESANEKTGAASKRVKAAGVHVGLSPQARAKRQVTPVQGVNVVARDVKAVSGCVSTGEQVKQSVPSSESGVSLEFVGLGSAENQAGNTKAVEGLDSSSGSATLYSNEKETDASLREEIGSVEKASPRGEKQFSRQQVSECKAVSGSLEGAPAYSGFLGKVASKVRAMFT